MYLACPAAPFVVEGGWERAAPALVDSVLDQVEARAPGFRDSVRDVVVRAPRADGRGLRWPGAHPMVLDVTPDQLAMLRPTRRLADHSTPVGGLYITGAGTAPVGGIAGAPGKAAARRVLADQSSGRRA